MRCVPVLTVLVAIAAFAPRPQAQEAWNPPQSESERRRALWESAFREYLRLNGIASHTERWYAYWVQLRKREEPLAGKTGDFWTIKELDRHFRRDTFEGGR